MVLMISRCHAGDLFMLRDSTFKIMFRAQGILRNDSLKKKKKSDLRGFKVFISLIYCEIQFKFSLYVWVLVAVPCEKLKSSWNEPGVMLHYLCGTLVEKETSGVCVLILCWNKSICLSAVMRVELNEPCLMH